MKRITNLVLMALPLFMAVTSAQAQSASQKRVSSLSPEDSSPKNQPSWLFLLETRTQWLLVLQENGDQPVDSHSEASSLPGGASGNILGVSGTAIGGSSLSSTPGSNFASGHTIGAGTEGTPSDTGKSTLIFEGNTLDVPLETPLGPPVKPSAPGS
ncbi:hypothetical protein IAD21_05204 [Abditibacteriota bacterium]|nr:hypothetical protein IAD21_05204 [Abditibacteriota bacterium]